MTYSIVITNCMRNGNKVEVKSKKTKDLWFAYNREAPLLADVPPHRRRSGFALLSGRTRSVSDGVERRRWCRGRRQSRARTNTKKNDNHKDVIFWFIPIG